MSSHLSLAVKPRFIKGTTRQAKFLGFSLRHTVRPLLNVWAQLPFRPVPPNLIEHAAKILPAPEGTMWRPVDLSDCRAEWLQAKGVGDIHAGNERAILYFHGGAFVTCGLNTHRTLAARISYTSEQPILNVGYRQMPHDPLLNTVDDCVDGFRWLLDQGYQAKNITVAGDSAGGYLAFCVARAVIDNGWGRPAGVVALSPLLDFDPTRKLSHRNANRCETFPPAAIARLTEFADDLDVRHGVAGQVICPVDMNKDDLPPSLITMGSHEVLLADAELMANRLVSAGIPCELQVWDRQVHVFQAAAAWLPEARASIKEIGSFIRNLEAVDVPVATPVRAPQTTRRRRVASVG